MLKRLRVSRSSLRRVAAHTSFIHDRLLKSFLVLSLLAALIHGLSILFLPHTSPSTPSPLAFITMFTSLIYVIAMIYVVSSMAQDLRDRTAELYLSQPLTRIEYAFSWLITSVVTPSLVYLSAVALPVAILDPHLLLSFGFEELGYLVVEGLFAGSLAFITAVLTRSRGLTFFIGLFWLLVLPFVLMMGVAVLSFSSMGSHQSPAAKTLLSVFAVLYPYKFYLMSASSLPASITPFQAVVISFSISVLFLAASLQYVRYRLEV